MSPEYGATCGFFPVDEVTLAYLRTTNRGQAAKLVEAYAKKQGLWRSKKSPEPIFTDTLSLDLGDVEPSLAGPKRPQDRVPLSQAAQQFVSQHGEGVRPQGRRQAGQVRGRRLRSRPWRHRDRRHHLVHQHLEPLRHAGRRPDRAQRGQARAQGQAVGEDLAGAGLAGRDRVSRGLGPAEGPQQDRLQPGGLRLHQLHRQFGPAARSGDQGGQRRRPRGLRGAVGQSQLRGPRQSADPRQLSRLADAGGGLCAGRLDEDRHHQGSDRHRQGRQAGLSQGHLALEHGSPEAGRQVRHHQGLQEALRRRLQGRQVLARHQDQAQPDLCLGRQVDLRAQPALLRRHGQDPGRALQHRRAPARSASSAIRSRPTTSRPPARSRRTARPAPIWASTASRPRTSTSTARGAAITR